MDFALAPLWLTLAAFLSTMGGGALALVFREQLRHFLAFAVGAILGLVAFDLLPEIFAISRAHGFASETAMVTLLLGFLLLHGTDRLRGAGRPDAHRHEAHGACHAHRRGDGMLSAGVLAAHSIMDGMAIGIGWQVAPTVGVAVAVAVIAHDFSDGLNSVGLMLRHRQSRRRAIAMLLLDASGPVVGAAATLAVRIPPFALMLYLGFFAGSLLYIGLSDLLPAVYSRARGAACARLVGLTACGAAFSWWVLRGVA